MFFRAGKDREGEMRYNPFRITPYLLKVQGKNSIGGEEEESCCLALAERIISGYEGKAQAARRSLLEFRMTNDSTLSHDDDDDLTHLCSTSDPPGQANLHHHSLPRLCVPRSWRQVRNRLGYQEVLWTVWTEWITGVIHWLLSTEPCHCWDTSLRIWLARPCWPASTQTTAPSCCRCIGKVCMS